MAFNICSTSRFYLEQKKTGRNIISILIRTLYKWWIIYKSTSFFNLLEGNLGKTAALRKPKSKHLLPWSKHGTIWELVKRFLLKFIGTKITEEFISSYSLLTQTSPLPHEKEWKKNQI